MLLLNDTLFVRDFDSVDEFSHELQYDSELRELVEDGNVRLEMNRQIRNEVWDTIWPSIFIALLIYCLCAILWLLYNIKEYRKQRRKIKEEMRNWEKEKIKYLEIYHQIPIQDVEAGTSRTEHTELISTTPVTIDEEA
ncbi:unnamed protein product [Bursaphelenchus xylophilus]|uniref:(pine wood nematode) hypothetical protein n=1 Tax=Bursaphelenchus xylophilus TaxID=6326 RepID=A0A1I7RP80_BURXY|nr:unnamed protein product [Bursaphelenchus xylophilus]CAG9095566.1 unnamed protein product [Bursaphelenchus xylophilus]